MAALLGLTHLALGRETVRSGPRPAPTGQPIPALAGVPETTRGFYVDRIAVAAQHRNRQLGAQPNRLVNG